MQLPDQAQPQPLLELIRQMAANSVVQARVEALLEAVDKMPTEWKEPWKELGPWVMKHVDDDADDSNKPDRTTVITNRYNPALGVHNINLSVIEDAFFNYFCET